MTPSQTQPSSDFVSRELPLGQASKTQGCHGTRRPSGPKRPNGLRAKDEDKRPTEPKTMTRRRPTEPKTEHRAHSRTSLPWELRLAPPVRLRPDGTFACSAELGAPFASGSVAPVDTFACSAGSVLPSPPAWSRQQRRHLAVPRLRLGRMGRLRPRAKRSLR